MFGCNLYEMVPPPDGLQGFENLGQFFYRQIHPESRPIDQSSVLVYNDILSNLLIKNRYLHQMEKYWILVKLQKMALFNTSRTIPTKYPIF